MLICSVHHSSCVFVCCDLPYQYVGEYESKLGPDYFPPIHSEVSAHLACVRGLL